MSEADIVYYVNNGVMAVKPVLGSRLDKLVRRAKSEEKLSPWQLEQAWIFADPTTWRDAYGNDRTDHRQRGVVCGTYNEGHEFLDLCRRIGLRVEHGDLFVPCSNGQYRHGSFVDGAAFEDYPEHELRLVRYDLPTEVTLRELLAEHVDAATAGSDRP